MSGSNLIGRTLGDFRLIRLIGQGGMGAVYEAEQISLGRRVALKILSIGVGGSGSQSERFRREAEAAARLNHPSIVAIYAQGREGDLGFYAMELIDGESLDCLIARLRSSVAATTRFVFDPLAQTEKINVFPAAEAPPPPAPETPPPAAPSRPLAGAAGGLPDRTWINRAVQYAVEAARALAYAHSLGVLHRDIKPANLIVSSSGRVKITDFGLAGVRDAPGLTVSGEIMGTPAYMSPEQAKGAVRSISERSDVYSLGATLYEMATLSVPFFGATTFEIIRRIVSEEPTPARKINPRIPRDLDTIIAKMMDKDPARRYASAGEAADDLERFLRAEPIKARPLGPVGHATRAVRRHKAAAALAAAGVIVLVLFAGLARSRREWAKARQVVGEREAAAVVAKLVSEANQDVALGRQDDALEALDEALALRPDNAEALSLRSRLNFSIEEYGEAIQDLDRLLALQPKNAAALYLRSAAHRVRGEQKEADADERQALAINPETAEAYFTLATAQRTAGDVDKAIANLDKALKLNPSYYDALVARGQLCAQRKRWAGAETDFQRARSVAPGNPTPYPALADIAWRKGKPQEAFALLREARERLGKDDPDLLKAQGDLLRRNGQWAESIQALQKALLLQPRDPEIFHSLAATQFMAGDYAAAVESLKPPIESQPASRLLSRQLMLTLNRMGRGWQAARSQAYDTVVALSQKAAQQRGSRRRGFFAFGRAGAMGKAEDRFAASRPAFAALRHKAGATPARLGPPPWASPAPGNPLMLGQIALNFGYWNQALAYADEVTSRALSLAQSGRLAVGMKENALLVRAQALRYLGRFEEAARGIEALEASPDRRLRGRSERRLLDDALAAIQSLQKPDGSRTAKGLLEAWPGLGQLLSKRFPGSGGAAKEEEAAGDSLLPRLGARWDDGRQITPERVLEILSQPPSPLRLQAALKMAERARRRTEDHPESAQDWYDLGLAQIIQGDSSQAQRSLERAMGLDPLLDKPYRCRALLRLQTGDEDGALDDLLRASTAAPEDVEGLAYLLSLLYDTGRIAEADRIYDQASFQNADSVVVDWIFAEWCAGQLIHPERSLFHFHELSLDLGPDPKAPRFFDTLRKAAQAAGDWPLAAQAAERGPSVSPLLAALTAELAGDSAKARSLYEQLARSGGAQAARRGLQRLEAASAPGLPPPSPPSAKAKAARAFLGGELSIPPREAISLDGRAAAAKAIGPGPHTVEWTLDNGTNQRAEVQVPAEPPSRPAPVVILIVGGAGSDGAEDASAQSKALFDAFARFGFAVMRVEVPPAPIASADSAPSGVPQNVLGAAAAARRMLALLGEFGPKGADVVDVSKASVVGLGRDGVLAASLVAAGEPRVASAALVLSEAEARAPAPDTIAKGFSVMLAAALRSASGKRLLLFSFGPSPLVLEGCVEAARSVSPGSVRIAFDQFDDSERWKRRGRFLSLWLSGKSAL